MKKYLTCFLVLAFILSAFLGCEKNTDIDGGNTGETPLAISDLDGFFSSLGKTVPLTVSQYTEYTEALRQTLFCAEAKVISLDTEKKTAVIADVSDETKTFSCSLASSEGFKAGETVTVCARVQYPLSGRRLVDCRTVSEISADIRKTESFSALFEALLSTRVKISGTATQVKYNDNYRGKYYVCTLAESEDSVRVTFIQIDGMTLSENEKITVVGDILDPFNVNAASPSE